MGKWNSTITVKASRPRHLAGIITRSFPRSSWGDLLNDKGLAMCTMSPDGPSVFWVSTPRARKEHKCCECLSVISPGEEYELFEGVYDGSFDRYRTCSICRNVREAAQQDLRLDEGIAFGCLWETVGVEYEDAV